MGVSKLRKEFLRQVRRSGTNAVSDRVRESRFQGEVRRDFGKSNRSDSKVFHTTILH